MKKTIQLLVAITFLAHATFAQSIKGSDTCLPLVQKESESFMKKNPNSHISVTGGGSGVGIAALIDNSTDIAMSSRPIKMDEKMKVQEGGRSFNTTIFAYDALAVIVNPANKVDQLTKQQLSDIFTGKITNWKQVGGDDMKIVVYIRESSSGTFEFFKEHIMSNKNYAATDLSQPATGAIVQSVSQTKGAIGYVGLAYLNSGVKGLAVSYDGKTFVKPTVENAKNKSYPVTRPLFFYVNKSAAAKVKSFVDFVLSAEGQKIVQEVGYVPLN